MKITLCLELACIGFLAISPVSAVPLADDSQFLNDLEGFAQSDTATYEITPRGYLIKAKNNANSAFNKYN